MPCHMKQKEINEKYLDQVQHPADNIHLVLFIMPNCNLGISEILIVMVSALKCAATVGFGEEEQSGIMCLFGRVCDLSHDYRNHFQCSSCLNSFYK